MAELVGLNAEVPDILPKLSQLLQIQQQQQALGAQTAQTQGAQQTQRQRAALAKYDWNKHLGPDGTLDLNSLNDPELQAAAGDDYWDVVTRAVTAKTHQLEARSRLVGLKNEQRQAIASMVGGLLQDPDVVNDREGIKGNVGRQKINEAAMQLADTYGSDMLPVLESSIAPLKNVPPGRMADALRAIQMQAASASEQLEKQRPTYTSTGGELRNVNPYTPGASPSASTIPLGIPPGFHVVVDPRTQNPYLLNEQTGEVRDMGAGYPGQQPGPQPRAPGGVPLNVSPTAPVNPPSSLPRPFAPGQAATTTETAHAVAARTAAAIDQANRSPQAIDALSRARNILDTADLATGAQFGKFNQFRNALAGLGIVTEETTDANSLVKNLARYEAARASGAGLGHTDAARELNEKGSPNTKVDSKTLKGIVAQSLATEMAVQGYAKIQTGVTDPQQMARVENEFRNVPNLVEAYQYGLSRTPQEADAFLKEHGLSKAEIGKARAKLRALGAL